MKALGRGREGKGRLVFRPTNALLLLLLVTAPHFQASLTRHPNPD